MSNSQATPLTPYAKTETMWDDEGEEGMETINWLVAGQNSMEMHGYTIGDDGNDPTIKVMTSASGTWTFTFRDIVGTGRIQVGAGADYNPLDLIESLFQHVKSATKVISDKSKPKTAEVKVFDVTNFDKAFKVDWQ